jgi:microtubule-associated protein-like 5
MGSHITTVKMNSFRKNTSPLLNVTLSKLRDYHASFKSICDNFSMDLSEFEHIFGASESAFVIWDTDNNGLIDSLELFSGICIFSDTKFDDKIRCNYSNNYSSV